MKAQALLPLLMLTTVSVAGCAKQIGDGGSCFQSTECNSGSVCVDGGEYGKFCMKRCDAGVARCDNGEACVSSSDLVAGGGMGGAGGDGGMDGAGGVGGSAGGAGGAAGDGGASGGGGMGGASGSAGMGGSGGMGGMGGAGGVGGASGSAGAGGAGGVGGAGGLGGESGAGGEIGIGGMGGIGGFGGGGSAEDELWVCLPGGDRLNTSAFMPRIIGSPCNFSIECVRGGLCVFSPGDMCAGQGLEGPTCCLEACDPDNFNQCPFGFACIELEEGRGYCGTPESEGN